MNEGYGWFGVLFVLAAFWLTVVKPFLNRGR